MKVYLYDDNCSLNLRPIKDFIERTFKIPVVIKKVKDVVAANGLLLNLSAIAKRANYPYSIIVTKRLIGTIGDSDKRMHLRSSVLSYPSVISLSGIVEAPAKPREYYLAKQSLQGSGLWELEEARLKQKLKKQFIDYNDKRMPEVVKGLSAQALFFYLKGEPFCESKKCRLYNAHWQEDLIFAQIKSGKLCAKHSRVLEKLKLNIE